jgi:hypothetical protein
VVAGLLVRPKSRGADAAAGAILGFLGGATTFTLSVGWLYINVTAVLPVQADLDLLSRAALAEPAPPGDAADREGTTRPRPVDELLRKYPDLREVPAGERGQVLAKKISADLMAGIPPGIWFGALTVVFATVVFAAQVMAAGPLLRRQGPRLAILWPYLEVSFPATVLIVLANMALVGPYFNVPLRIWQLPLFVLLGLALTSTLRGWAWPWRLLLHAGWLFSAGMVGRTLPL